MSKTDIQSGMIIMSKAYLVVRISGTVDVPYWATTTMNLLKLEKKHRAVIIPEKDNTIGMLRKIQRSEEHTSELQSQPDLVCRLLLEKKKTHVPSSSAS